MFGLVVNVIEIYTDGGCRLTRPDKLGAWSYIIIGDGFVVDKHSGIEFDTTVNRMEYTGLIMALRALKWINITGHEIKITSDSQLLINQVTGKWNVNDPVLQNLRFLVLEAGSISLKDNQVAFIWNPRESKWTSECDKMCNEAMDQVR